MDAINTAETTGDYVSHARINEALKKFFENDENHTRFIEEINPTKSEVKQVKRAKKVKPMPTENELAKEVADQAINDPEVRRHFGLALSSSRPSRKKSQPRIQISMRSRSSHKMNPEEFCSRLM